MNFITLTLAFIVAQLVSLCIVMATLMNRRILKWYTKKCTKVAMEISEEMEDSM